MFKKYIAYESEDEKLGFFETEKEAEAWLKKEISDFIDCDGSMPDGCSNGFVAKIIGRVSVEDIECVEIEDCDGGE